MKPYIVFLFIHRLKQSYQFAQNKINEGQILHHLYNPLSSAQQIEHKQISNETDLLFWEIPPLSADKLDVNEWRCRCPLGSYGEPTRTAQKQGFAMGHSTRTDFTKCLTSSPPASKYNINSFLEQNKSSQRGYTFSLGRGDMLLNSYIGKPSAPPATKYSPDRAHNGRQEPIYSMRRRTTINDKLMTIDCQNSNPGPGTYTHLNPETDPLKSTRGFSSKFRNTAVHTLSRSKRFDASDTVTPGPGIYEPARALSKRGAYVVSKFQGGTMAKFNSAKKFSTFDAIGKSFKDLPGPGCYRVPSQFGQYDGDVYDHKKKK